MKVIQKNFQQGITLIELLITITLGMFAVLAITGLIIAAKLTQSTQNDAANIQDTARFVLDNISRSVKQAGYVNLDSNDVPVSATENMSASIKGFDASSLKAAKDDFDDMTIAKGLNDILALRFFGSGSPEADNTILNCAGFGVREPMSQNNAEEERGWSIYYVADDIGGEPALFCKYRSDDNPRHFKADAIARGIESFQVLYGINTDSEANSVQFLNARAVTALDSGIPEREINKKTHWKKIVAVKVALLIRGAENSGLGSSTTPYNLFGQDFGNRISTDDKGTEIKESHIPLAHRIRQRKMFSTTIHLRNQS